MIRFESTCRLVHFQFSLVPVLVNVSMWSEEHMQKPVVIVAVDDALDPQVAMYGHELLVKLNVDNNSAVDRASLLKYLTTHLPADYNVSGNGSHVVIQRAALQFARSKKA